MEHGQLYNTTLFLISTMPDTGLRYARSESGERELSFFFRFDVICDLIRRTGVRGLLIGSFSSISKK